MGYIHIRSPKIFELDGGRYFGGNQSWYADTWKQRAGCGPTSCAHLMLYLAKTRPELSVLLPSDCSTKEDFLSLMNAVWEYVTPGSMGVNSTAMFTGGAVAFAKDRDIALTCRVLEIGAKKSGRPSLSDMAAFISNAIQDDLPVAFLNLSNGALKNLDNWHWVTLTAYDSEKHSAIMLDQGRKQEIDMLTWLDTTLMGGGLVAVGVGNSCSKQECAG